MSLHDSDRSQALGAALVAVHDELRTHLDLLLDAFDDPAIEGTGRPLPRSLRQHCLAFCAVVTRHHTSEDNTAFPALATAVPELAPVLAELAHDHTLVADLLGRIERLATAAHGADTAAREALRGEVEGLASVLESHLRWEERRIVEALGRLDGATLPAAEMFGWAPR
ncbi:hemerythrin domain-containing protein [Mumia sp. DW29H23]|uniref:hemerythrin domain-containing protein n=1 Tax=Mumia sp. DW29H23 TaxID=3421241 RepID=UPI003D691416